MRVAVAIRSVDAAARGIAAEVVVDDRPETDKLVLVTRSRRRDVRAVAQVLAGHRSACDLDHNEVLMVLVVWEARKDRGSDYGKLRSAVRTVLTMGDRDDATLTSLVDLLNSWRVSGNADSYMARLQNRNAVREAVFVPARELRKRVRYPLEPETAATAASAPTPAVPILLESVPATTPTVGPERHPVPPGEHDAVACDIPPSAAAPSQRPTVEVVMAHPPRSRADLADDIRIRIRRHTWWAVTDHIVFVAMALVLVQPSDVVRVATLGGLFATLAMVLYLLAARGAGRWLAERFFLNDQSRVGSRFMRYWLRALPAGGVIVYVTMTLAFASLSGVAEVRVAGLYVGLGANVLFLFRILADENDLAPRPHGRIVAFVMRRHDKILSYAFTLVLGALLLRAGERDGFAQTATIGAAVAASLIYRASYKRAKLQTQMRDNVVGSLAPVANGSTD